MAELAHMVDVYVMGRQYRVPEGLTILPALESCGYPAGGGGGEQILALYPDIVKCFGCNTCTKSCPQELETMWFMSDALRGDIRQVAVKSFDCVMCGLCAARCPQGLVRYKVAPL